MCPLQNTASRPVRHRTGVIMKSKNTILEEFEIQHMPQRARGAFPLYIQEEGSPSECNPRHYFNPHPTVFSYYIPIVPLFLSILAKTPVEVYPYTKPSALESEDATVSGAPMMGRDQLSLSLSLAATKVTRSTHNSSAFPIFPQGWPC